MSTVKEKTCNCESCKRVTKYSEIVDKLESSEDRDFMEEFLGLYINTSTDRDYYKSKWKGDWPYTEFMKCPECGHNINRKSDDVMKLYNDGDNISPLYKDADNG